MPAQRRGGCGEVEPGDSSSLDSARASAQRLRACRRVVVELELSLPAQLPRLLRPGSPRDRTLRLGERPLRLVAARSLLCSPRRRGCRRASRARRQRRAPRRASAYRTAAARRAGLRPARVTARRTAAQKSAGHRRAGDLPVPVDSRLQESRRRMPRRRPGRRAETGAPAGSRAAAPPPSRAGAPARPARARPAFPGRGCARRGQDSRIEPSRNEVGLETARAGAEQRLVADHRPRDVPVFAASASRQRSASRR